ncbi:protein claret segregational [Athalia rosae]|uniref:protein claret segregational n=1 Tax=Athalia rosae TaxID=37344 RepID=UPI0020335185|nr:protein claret segregational [Athalia rosae]
MESRLPKPKFTLKKAISASNVNSASGTNGNKIETDKALKRVISTNGSNAADNLKKAQSTMSVVSKSTEEPLPPRRPLPVVRAKTLATITRNVNTTKAGIKRPGTLSQTVENKRPNIKTVSQAPVNTRILRNAAVTVSSNAATSKVVSKQKPKWDLKGRLEQTSSELATTKERINSIIEKNTQLQSEIDILKESEANNREKAEKFETLCSNLKLEVVVLQNKNTTLQNNWESLSKEHESLEDALSKTKVDLHSYQEKCKKQEVELHERTEKLETLELKNKSYKETLTELNKLNADLQNMVHTMDKDRRHLHNCIQELKGNIRVFCRVRPRIDKESCKGLCSIAFPDECTIEVGRSEIAEASTCGGRPRLTKQEFSFDKVFPPNVGQAAIFEELALLVQSALEGYNVCVFAYGQTGSGKTYTMEGGPGEGDAGMIPRTVKHIFEEKRQFELLGWEYRIEASFLEIYNEHIVDLLDSYQKTHEIRMTDSKGTDIYVSNLRVEEICTPQELENCLKTAQRNRAVAATQSNERSSRSHSVARIKLIGTHKTRNEVCTGTLNLVDLAGSEKLRHDEVARTTETKNINKSLANLGNVILALLKKQDHVPYRNSKLTHLLMPSLGGNSKTLMLLNISPLDECYNETLNSLRFASNVNSCKTGNIKRTRATLTVAT